jgi:hypothetical protein
VSIIEIIVTCLFALAWIATIAVIAVSFMESSDD